MHLIWIVLAQFSMAVGEEDRNPSTVVYGTPYNMVSQELLNFGPSGIEHKMFDFDHLVDIRDESTRSTPAQSSRNFDRNGL